VARTTWKEWLNEELDLALEARGESQMGRLRRRHEDQRSDHVVVDEILSHADDPEASTGAFDPTFSSSRYERVWILTYLGPLYDRRLIADVLHKVKGGKEANVYCCAPGPATGSGLLAAKVYRPRQFRNLRNDALYRQGREILGGRGQPVRDRRALHAIRMGTRKGKEMEHVSWLAHEFATLGELHAAGVRVPTPVAFANNTVLMEYAGTLSAPAPVLRSVTLGGREAAALFDALLADVERMLARGIVHADLSAFNVLYLGGGDYRIIDFPQSVNAATHGSAYALFRRDVTRLCQYFSRYGLAADPAALTEEMWGRAGPVGP
jgi:RIO kinase 1